MLSFADNSTLNLLYSFSEFQITNLMIIDDILHIKRLILTN